MKARVLLSLSTLSAPNTVYDRSECYKGLQGERKGGREGESKGKRKERRKVGRKEKERDNKSSHFKIGILKPREGKRFFQDHPARQQPSGQVPVSRHSPFVHRLLSHLLGTLREGLHWP